MNDLRTQTRDTGWRRRRRTVPTRLVDVTAAALFAVIVTAIAVQSPPRAPDVTIDNPTPFDLTIKVSDGSGVDWMGFALVEAHTQTVVRAPIDQGADWSLDFGDGREYPIARSVLRDAGWRLRVPDEVAVRLAAAGVAPAPQRDQR
jgi:hypothetical protein